MKKSIVLLLAFLVTGNSSGESISSAIEIVTVYSQNKEYYLKSVPYDNVEESLYGITSVYKTSSDSILYSINRHFNYTGYPNKITLSNDGKHIAYLNDFYGDDQVAESKTLTFYKKGKLLKEYTSFQLTGCDDNAEDCYTLYRNSEAILRDSTKYINYQLYLGFKEGTSEAEKFANSFNIFSQNDTLYLINKYKKILKFPVVTGEQIPAGNFDSSYVFLKALSRINEVTVVKVNSPSFDRMPTLKNGRNFYTSIAGHIGMKSWDFFNEKDRKCKSYPVILDCIIDREGKAVITSIETDKALPRDAIIDFVVTSKFDMSDLPVELDRWRIRRDYFYFRNPSKAKAKKEKGAEIIEERQAYLKRLTLDSIGGFYIPKGLGECFAQLDSMLKEKDKADIKNLESRGKTIRYHHGLGTYLRNTWGLWGGSRLQVYFTKRGVFHPDSMSSIILEHYYDYLNGDTESWKNWETLNPVK